MDGCMQPWMSVPPARQHVSRSHHHVSSHPPMQMVAYPFDRFAMPPAVPVTPSVSAHALTVVSANRGNQLPPMSTGYRPDSAPWDDASEKRKGRRRSQRPRGSRGRRLPSWWHDVRRVVADGDELDEEEDMTALTAPPPSASAANDTSREAGGMSPAVQSTPESTELGWEHFSFAVLTPAATLRPHAAQP